MTDKNKTFFGVKLQTKGSVKKKRVIFITKK